MEESITLKDFLAYYKKTMRLEPVDAGSYSPLVLAYIGDAVYEVMIRARVINRGSMQVNKMHKRSAMLVNAGTQAQLIRSIEEELTPQEHAVYKRGRNAKSVTMANTLLWQITVLLQAWRLWWAGCFWKRDLSVLQS